MAAVLPFFSDFFFESPVTSTVTLIVLAIFHQFHILNYVDARADSRNEGRFEEALITLSVSIVHFLDNDRASNPHLAKGKNT